MIGMPVVFDLCLAQIPENFEQRGLLLIIMSFTARHAYSAPFCRNSEIKAEFVEIDCARVVLVVLLHQLIIVQKRVR